MFGLNVGPPLEIGFPNLPKPHCLGQGMENTKQKIWIKTNIETS